MLLSLVQFNPIFGDVESNSSKMADYVKKTKSDIIVFPELCISGYDFKDEPEVKRYGFDFKSDFINSFSVLAQDLNKIIIFGFPEISVNKTYNSVALLFPDKSYNCVYRKTHLFFRERFCFSETDLGFFVIDYKPSDIKIGPMICYDWRFPEAARTVALKGADLIVCPSNLVTNVWHISTPSRALENKVYFAVANRTGNENRNGNELNFNGASKIYSYNGSILADCDTVAECEITSEIEPQKTRNKSFNEFNDIFNDRRPQFYI
jgi:predicted amidohydrolase